MRYFKIIIAVILLVGCEEYFHPDIDEMEPAYVIDGLLTDEPGPYKVKIMKTSGYNGKPELVTGANVHIECSDGKSYVMKLDSTGYYLSDSASFVGEVGKSYRLVATTVDNRRLESAQIKMLPCPDIDEVNGMYYEKKKIVTNGDEFFDELESGICALNTTSASGFTPYYRYECKIVIQTQQHYSQIGVTADRYIYRPLKSTGFLFIADANNYSDNKIINNQLYKTANKTMLMGIDSLVEGIDTFNIRNYGIFVRVKQLSMDEKQYKFWKAVQDQQGSANNFFGQTENQPVGNVTCKTGEKTFGYFCVSAVKQSIGAFSLKQSDKSIKRYDISYFPDTDTVAIYEKPRPFTKFFEN